jgi:hypothetical protein
MSLEEQIWQISQKPANASGFTRFIYGLNRPARGYCVAYVDTQNYFGKAGLRKALAHAQTHAQIIGGWAHLGEFYFDSVRVYHTERAAIEAAIRESQIGYYDLTGRYVQMMSGGKLLPRYQKMLDRWNRQRARSGHQPFRKL